MPLRAGVQGFLGAQPAGIGALALIGRFRCRQALSIWQSRRVVPTRRHAGDQCPIRRARLLQDGVTDPPDK